MQTSLSPVVVFTLLNTKENQESRDKRIFLRIDKYHLFVVCR